METQDLTDLTDQAHQEIIISLSKKSLRELRRRRELVKAQQGLAAVQLEEAPDPATRQRFEKALNNYQIMDKHLIEAIMLREFDK